MTMQFDASISKRLFGFESDDTLRGFSCNEAIRQSGLKTVHPLAVTNAVNPDHVFEDELFSYLKLWWEWHDTTIPLYVSGPSGCGKTTTVLQFLARLRMPAVNFTCRHSMDMTDLLGHWGPGKNKHDPFVWHEGPLTVAWKYGYAFVINEFSLAPSPVWVALNDLFEGGPLAIDVLGISVSKHPNTRIVITDNCRALADNDAYVGRRQQDITSAERFWHVEAHWPDEKEELNLLMRKAQVAVQNFQAILPKGFEKVAEAALRFAQHTRSSSGIANKVPAVSTRVLIRFVELIAVMLVQGFERQRILESALKLAIARGLSPKKETILLDMVHEEFAQLHFSNKSSL